MQVDHIETVASNPRRRLDPSNLQTLCDHHHALITNAHDVIRQSANNDGPVPSGQVDHQGRHLDPLHPWFEARGDAPVLTRSERKQASIIGNRRQAKAKGIRE
jgi:hypothetical protein